MAREPQRSPAARPLGAAIIPVERALIARAKALSMEVLTAVDDPDATEEESLTVGITQHVRALVSAELLALAEELKYW